MKVSLPMMLANLCALAAPPVIAGTQTGLISGMNVRDSDGLIWVTLRDVGPTGRPLCAAHTTYWIIPNETTETGKRLFDSLTAAAIAGYQVTIHGNDTCNRWPDGEDIEYVEFWGHRGAF